MNARSRDLLGSVIMLVFVGSLWIQRDYITPFGGIFPDIVLVLLGVLVVLTLVLMPTSFRAIKADTKEENKKKQSFHWFDMAVVGLILLGWTFLLRYLGFIVTGVIGFGSISWFLNERRKTARGFIESVLIGVAMVAILVLVFEYLLQVPLPKGIIFD